MFVCESVWLFVFVVERWGANNRAASSFRRGKSNTPNRTAVPVTCVTFAVTGDRHRRATHSQRISLKSASSRASGLEVLCFLPLGAAGGQMHQAFSGTLAGIRPISWTAVKDNQGGIHSDCGNFVLSGNSWGVCFFRFVATSGLSRIAAAPNASFSLPVPVVTGAVFAFPLQVLGKYRRCKFSFSHHFAPFSLHYLL